MNKITKKIAGFVAALALLVSATTAGAQTTAELQAQINALMAQLSAMTGASSGAAMSAQFTSDMGMGATGGAVSSLQNFLIANGYAIPAGATGYFGTQTAAAVKLFQAAKGVPQTGYVGPLTRAALNASSSVGGSTGGSTGGATCPNGNLLANNCMPGSTPDTSSDLEGTDGTLSDVDVLSQYSNEDVGEGEEEVKVAGFEVEASNEGDVRIRSVKLAFDPSGNSTGDSDHLDDYVQTVKVWMGDTEVGSADVDDFNEESDDTYTKTITLDDVVVMSDETEKFYITVDAVGSFDSTDIDSDSWTVGVQSIRFEDGSGVVTTDTTTGDLGAATLTVTTAGTGGVGMDFVSFSTAADTELKISKLSDSPDESVVVIDDTDETDNVTLLKGKLRLDGTSDVTIDEFPVTLTTVGGANVAAVTGSVTLKLGDDEYNESVTISGATTGTVTFDNLDFVIEAGETVEFEVLADINDIEAGNLDEGDTLKAEVTATNRSYMDVENEEGDQLTDSTEKSGIALGDAQEFRTEGIRVALVSTSATSNDNDAADTGTFKIKFKVMAIGETLYVGSLAAKAVTYSVYDADGVATTANTISASISNVTDNDKTSPVGNYQIDEGEENEETFELTITVPNGAGDASAQYYAALTGVLWDDDDIATPAETNTSGLDEFQTSTVFLDNA